MADRKMIIKNEKGFSLVELAILSVIAGLILSSVIQTYNRYAFKREAENTEARLNEISSAIGVFLGAEKRYPCPAVPGISQVDEPEIYGRENCPAALALAIGDCVNGLCRINGARDTGGPVDTVNLPATPLKPARTVEVTTPDGDPSNDTVIIGAVPFKSLNMSTNMSTQDFFDGYGRLYSYAVTRTAIDAATYDKKLGTVELISEGGNVITNDEGGYLAIIYSHGEDGKGGYSVDGVRSPCTAGARDTENCDDDATFRQIINPELESSRRRDSATFYDDSLTVNFATGAANWTRSTADPTDIYNPSGSHIGIGTNLPEFFVDVEGDVRIDDEATAASFCNYGPDTSVTPPDPIPTIPVDCFDAEIIAGSGMSCGANQAMVGIANGAPICTPISMSGVTPNQTCPSGQFIYAFDGGNILCR